MTATTHNDGQRNVLLVVDMQNYFADPASPFGLASRFVNPDVDQYFSRLENSVIPNIKKLITKFRESNQEIIFTRFGSNQADSSDLPKWARLLNQMAKEKMNQGIYPQFQDDWAQIVSSLAPLDGELVIDKTTAGVLAASKIDLRLKENAVENIFIVGVCTDVCVAQCARELSDADLNVNVIEDACDTPVSLGESADYGSFLRQQMSVFTNITTTEQVVSGL